MDEEINNFKNDWDMEGGMGTWAQCISRSPDFMEEAMTERKPEYS